MKFVMSYIRCLSNKVPVVKFEEWVTPDIFKSRCQLNWKHAKNHVYYSGIHTTHSCVSLARAGTILNIYEILYFFQDFHKTNLKS